MRLERGQKLVLGLLSLALLGVLVVLGSLLRQPTPQDTTSPLSTDFPSADRTPVTPTLLETIGPRVTPSRPTAVPTASAPVSPTLAHSGAAEILAARRITALTEDVGQIRELPKQREVPLNFLSEKEMTAYLRRLLADAQRREFVERQQALLAALDIIPGPDEAFPPPVQGRVDHLVAFYDPAEGQIFVGPSELRGDPPDVSLVHQYAHALIDQHFDLASLASAPLSADALRAQDALVEGDATAVLMLQRFGDLGRIDDAEGLGDLADHLSEVELTDYEGYLTSRAMQDLFVFPYREGTRFVAALLREGWWPTVNRAYLDPPASTEQILHPEKYLLPRDEPRVVQLPDLRGNLGEGWRLVAQDVLGELVLRAHLDKYLLSTPEAEAAAAGWGGDLAAVWRNIDGRQLLLLRTEWDDVDEADEFVRSYTVLIDKRLRGASSVVRPILPPNGHWWRGQGGNAYLEQSGKNVLVIWAPDTETLEQVLDPFVFGEQ